MQSIRCINVSTSERERYTPTVGYYKSNQIKSGLFQATWPIKTSKNIITLYDLMLIFDHSRSDVALAYVRNVSACDFLIMSIVLYLTIMYRVAVCSTVQ